MRFQLPDLSALESLLDMSDLSDSGSQEKTYPVDQSTHKTVETQEKSLLSDMEWPNVMDGNTGGKTSRIERLPVRMGYKDIKMEVERLSPIRICRVDTQDQAVSYNIPKVFKTPENAVIPTRWLSRHTKTSMEKAMKESKENRQCADCQISVPNGKVAGRHVPQHYHKTFCQFGHGSRSRDMVCDTSGSTEKTTQVVSMEVSQVNYI
jgi:hypothetical protein